MTSPTPQAPAREAVEQIQKALNAGPTNGPWTGKYSSGAGEGVWADLRPNLGERFSKDFPFFQLDSRSPPQIQIAYEAWVQFPSEEWSAMQKANTAYIAACNPENIRAVLALLAAKQEELDKMRAALTDVCRLFPTDFDMTEAGWSVAEIEAACRVYDKARAALSPSQGA